MLIIRYIIGKYSAKGTLKLLSFLSGKQCIYIVAAIKAARVNSTLQINSNAVKQTRFSGNDVIPRKFPSFIFTSANL